MKLAIPFCFIALLSHLYAQPVIVKNDNGTPYQYYQNIAQFTEESVLLKPAGPCKVLEIQFFLTGAIAATDTIWVVGDPSEGAVPPTNWVWSYNAIINPIIVNYAGQAGWVNVDVRAANLHLDGYDRLCIQHRIKSKGPWFVIDNDGASQPYASFLTVIAENSSLGFPGKYYLAGGDFLVRLLVEYDFPSGQSSQPPPTPSLVDVTKSAGLKDASGNYLKGARISAVDWNSDGLDDVAIGSGFFQNKGNGVFENVSSSIGITAGATVWGDFNNDAKIDCYAVNGGAGDKLYRNNGDGSFTDVTASAKITNPYPTVTPCWFDYNRDGKLDLFISNGRTESGGVEQYFPDQLWRNNGDGTFSNVTVAAGISAGEPSPFYDCWGATIGDYNNDGYPDIFVATYRLAPDLLYRNNKNGTFTEVGNASGVRGVATASPEYFGHGLGCEFADFNHDGLVDLAVGNLGHPDWRGQVSNPSLIFKNNGGPGYTFSEVHKLMGLKFFEMNTGLVWLDLDHDGELDLFHCQYAYNAEGSNGEPRRLSRMYINQGLPNYSLLDRTWHLGSLIHGAWTAVRLDYDNDGDMDLLVASPTEAVKLFRNDAQKRGRWLEIRLSGSPADNVAMDAFGSKVLVYADGKLFYRDIMSGGSGVTASQNSNVLHFGLGAAMKIDSVVVKYPNGVSRAFTSLQFDKRYWISYSGNVSTGVNDARLPETWSVARATYRKGILFVIAETPNDIEDLRIDVFNQLGEKLSTLPTTTLISGQNVIDTKWRLSNGMYFVRFSAKDKMMTVKVGVVE